MTWPEQQARHTIDELLDAALKARFIIVDAVGVVAPPTMEPRTLNRKHSEPLGRLLEDLAQGADDEETRATLAARLARQRPLTEAEQYDLLGADGGARVD